MHSHKCAYPACHNVTTWSLAHCSVECANLHVSQQHFTSGTCHTVVKAHVSYDVLPVGTSLLVPFHPRVRDILKYSLTSPKPSEEEARHHLLRRQYITASNVASILGCNRYKSRRAVFKQYVLGDTARRNTFMQRGIEMEPVIANKFVQASGKHCIYNHGLCVSKRFDFIGATFDLLTTDGFPVEIKYLANRQPDPSAPVPFIYWVQCQVQMEVADSLSCYYVEYKEGQDDQPDYFSILQIERDTAWFDSIVPFVKQFYDDVMVLRRVLLIR